jgi:hypothetical protein
LTFPSKTAKQRNNLEVLVYQAKQKKIKGGIELPSPGSIGKRKVEIPPSEQEESKIHIPTSEAQFNIYIQKGKKKESSIQVLIHLKSVKETKKSN